MRAVRHLVAHRHVRVHLGKADHRLVDAAALVSLADHVVRNFRIRGTAARRLERERVRRGRHHQLAGGVERQGQAAVGRGGRGVLARSEEHTSELQSLMRISYAVFCLKTKTTNNTYYSNI